MGSVPQTFEQHQVIAKVQEQQTNGQPEKSELYQNLLPKRTIKGLSAFTLISGILSIFMQVITINFLKLQFLVRYANNEEKIN